MRLLTLTVLLVLAGCTSPDDVTTDAGVQDMSVADAAVDAQQICTVMRLTTVSGTIVDESGTALEGALAQFCVQLENGGASCIMPTPTDATGIFHVTVPTEVNCIVEAAMRVFVADGAHADTFVHVPIESATAGSVHWDEPFIVYAVHPPADLPEYGDADAVRRVDLGDGLSLDVTPSALSIMRNYSELAARSVPLTDAPAFLHESPEMLGLYAFNNTSVVGTQFPVHIANSTHLAAGTHVELYVLGGIFTLLRDHTQVHEADFEQYGTATVSADGSEIVSDADSGLPFLNWLGYRVAP